MQDFEGVWVHLQNVQSLHFHWYCNTYDLRLKTIHNIRSANSALNLYFYHVNFDGF